ncbi:ribosome recycling factor [Calditrichota bacterium]
MMSNFVKDAKERMTKSVEHIRDEMMRIRTGKATSSLLDGIQVDYYGTPTPLNQISNISTPEARLLVVLPYDKGMMQAVEKAILASDVGLTPQNDGSVIRLTVPMLTAERREELIKVVRRVAEEGRVSVRNVRRDINDHIKKAEKDKEISEDESHRLQDEIQKETDNFIKQIDEVLEKREIDIKED